ncbi:MAG: hypothetical protein HZA02_01960 [Nitrospinae bacterium]|nr:hypothetical protein [Nitrospinota bacterium]
MDFLYHTIIGAAILAASPFVLLRMAVDPDFRAEIVRRASAVADAPALRDCVWVHASSAGEARIAQVLARALKDRLGARPLALSAFTRSGYDLARAGKAAPVFRLPPDFILWLGPLFAKLNPLALVLVEAEFWPGLLRLCKRRGVPVLLVNGRMTEKSFSRYRLVRPLFRWLAEPIELFSMRAEEDAGRVAELGVDKGKIRVTGNMKFDVPAQGSERPSEADDRSPLVVFGSTRPGDEGPALEAMARLSREVPSARFVLAPRHIDRRPELEVLIQEQKLDYELHSNLGKIGGKDRPRVVLLDRMGELGGYYARSCVAFVGGGFRPEYGGQNILEPASYGQPVIFGKHMDNFAEEARLLTASGGGIRIGSPAELHSVLLRLLKDPEERLSRGRAARETVASNRGAVQRNLDLLAPFLQSPDR